MNPELPAEAVELAAAASKAFDALGGVDVARRAETDPGIRSTEVAPALDQLGIDDLDPRAGDLALSAAAALCFRWRAATTKLAARRLRSHSHGRGLVSSKSFRSNSSARSGVAKPPKFDKWQSPQICSVKLEFGVLARSWAWMMALPR